MLMGATRGQVTGHRFSGVSRPSRAGATNVGKGPDTGGRAHLSQALFLLWTNSCLQGWLSSQAGQHCPPHPAAPGLVKAQAPELPSPSACGQLGRASAFYLLVPPALSWSQACMQPPPGPQESGV